jgi:BirA family biotin operon repressor/biotin-[acetyl-CoA-carboxylase] ligase
MQPPAMTDALDADAIRAGLAAQGVSLVVEVRDRCASTNTELLERGSDGTPVLLLAEEQTAGRGRRGRRWHSIPGAALMFSLRWHFSGGAGRLGGLSLAAGVGVAKTLCALGAHGVALKWPNDLLAQSARGAGKLGGILIETRASAGGNGGSQCAAVVGVGLNCRSMPGLESRLKRRIASLDELVDPLPTRNEIAIRVAAGLARTMQEFADAGFEAFRSEWESMHANQGESMKVRTADGRVVSGIAEGLAADGGLLLRTRRGVKAVNSGTVVRGRAA